jgi:hypothetical protein
VFALVTGLSSVGNAASSKRAGDTGGVKGTARVTSSRGAVPYAKKFALLGSASAIAEGPWVAASISAASPVTGSCGQRVIATQFGTIAIGAYEKEKRASRLSAAGPR